MDSPAILRLVFEQLAGHYDSLCAVGLTCRAWRALSLPALLQIVDVSSHNNGRVPEHDTSVTPFACGDHSARYRPPNLVSRQHAFLRLLLDRPGHAKHIKSLTWTLIWEHRHGTLIADIDRQTWKVFAQLENVIHLDLACLHEDCGDDYIRKNPDRLFPAVKYLRLLGWMHRGLVKAILRSINVRRLQGLKLDNLLDEGSLPDGSPLCADVALDWVPNARRSDSPEGVDERLFQRQEHGKACIFPGPMWYPLRLIAAQGVECLSELEVKLGPFNMDLDLRSYSTLFRETASLLTSSRKTLKALHVVFREDRQLYKETMYVSQCGTGHSFSQTVFRPWCIRMATAFLAIVLNALKRHSFPVLQTVQLEGFHFLKSATALEAADAGLNEVLSMVQECENEGATFIDISCVDYRPDYMGQDCKWTDIPGIVGILAHS